MFREQMILVLVVGTVVGGVTFDLVRRYRLKETYAFVWVLVSLAIISIPVLFDQYVRLGALFGIIDSTSSFVAFSLIGLLMMAVQFSLALTAAEQRERTLAQSLALLEFRVREIEEHSRPTTISRPSAEANVVD